MSKRQAAAMVAQVPGVAAARDVLAEAREKAPGAWCLDVLAGRFVELSGGAGGAALTAASVLIYEAQRRGGLAAWVGQRSSTFYPPDFTARGVDVSALPVVHAEGVVPLCRAADALLRSSSFAVVVLDLERRARLSFAVQSRLAGLASRHNTALIAITQKDGAQSSLGPSISLRGETHLRRVCPDTFTCDLQAVKDKRNAPGWCYTEICHGSDGLC